VAKSLFDVEAGDFISVYDRDFIVDQIYRLGSGQTVQANYRLRDGQDVKWLALRNSDTGDQIYLGEELILGVDQTGDLITVDEQLFRRVKETEGRAIGSSSAGYPRYINLTYLDYAAASGALYMFIQKSDEGRIVFSGEPVINSAIMVFPKPK